jgi:long-chain acyl-CoA synthetase
MMALPTRLSLAAATDLTLGTFLDRFAEIWGDRVLAEQPDGLCYTYAQARDRVLRASATLQTIITPGDRVAVRTPNNYDLFLSCLAVARAGGVAVPVNPRMAEAEIAYVVADAEVQLSIDDFEAFVGNETAPAVFVDPRSVAVVFYTSGTTGRPKGAQLTHRALLAGIRGRALVPATLLENGCVSGMPVAHIAGFTMLTMLASFGVPVYLLPKFRPTDALDAIERRRPMMFIGVPAMYRMMLEAGAADRNLSSVHMWSSGADTLPDDIVSQFRRLGSAFTIPVVNRGIGMATFIDGYGSVELGGGVAIRVITPVPLPTSGWLRPLPGNRVRVVDDTGGDVATGEVGELLIRGPSLMRGYHARDDETIETFTKDGWLRTGDLARPRPLGCFELAGRKKDVIKHGGYSVFAVEVERVLEEHPTVIEAAVLGLPDERKGEIPVAAVRVAAGHTLESEDIVRFARENLSDYKVPQRVLFVDELPRTGTDKVDKNALRSHFGTTSPSP